MDECELESWVERRAGKGWRGYFCSLYSDQSLTCCVIVLL